MARRPRFSLQRQFALAGVIAAGVALWQAEPRRAPDGKLGVVAFLAIMAAPPCIIAGTMYGAWYGEASSAGP